MGNGLGRMPSQLQAAWQLLKLLLLAILGVLWLFSRCLWASIRFLRKVSMGKWAQYQKRGTARHHGFLSAPVATDWSVGTPLASSCPMNRLVPIPTGALDWSIQTTLATGGAPVGTAGISASTPISATGLTTATNYRSRIAWFNGTLRVSDWSDWKTFTTA